MEVKRLAWDAANRAKIREHGMTQPEVDSMLTIDAWVPIGHPDYPDQVRIVGPTSQGRHLTVALAPTSDPTLWRPVTGWRSTHAEMGYYRLERP